MSSALAGRYLQFYKTIQSSCLAESGLACHCLANFREGDRMEIYYPHGHLGTPPDLVSLPLQHASRVSEIPGIYAAMPRVHGIIRAMNNGNNKGVNALVLVPTTPRCVHFIRTLASQIV